MDITINIPGLSDLAASIGALAQAMSGQTKPGAAAPTPDPVSNLTLVQPQPPLQYQPTVAPVIPPQQPIVGQSPVVAPRPDPMQTAVPTSPQNYTLDHLAVAATQLMDAGRRTDLVALLSKFGVPALTSLPKEHYGVFATELRAMGARL